MGEFLDAALGFPAVLFGAALLVVVAYWLLVLVGAAEHDAFGGHVHFGHGHGIGHGHGHGLGRGPGHGPGRGRGLGRGHRGPDTQRTGAEGVPVTVPVSLMVAVAWFTSLTGSVLVRRSAPPGALRTTLSWAVLAAALLLSWTLARLLTRRLSALFPEQPPPSRRDFVGLTCTIRTGSVSADFGQAEVAAEDGSTAVVQVRQSGGDLFALGSTALLYAYDDEGEFFWVTPFDPALDPRTAT